MFGIYQIAGNLTTSEQPWYINAKSMYQPIFMATNYYLLPFV